MPFNFFKRQNCGSVADLYENIVQQARHQHFYLEWKVPDTIEGRFDMVVLHVILFLYRIEAESKRENEIGQKLFDHFFVDMEGNLRELGVNDLKVPKKVRKMAEAFYGRAQAYRQALANGSLSELSSALKRNLFPETNDSTCSETLAKYAMEATADLSKQSFEKLTAGKISWPTPKNCNKPG